MTRPAPTIVDGRILWPLLFLTLAAGALLALSGTAAGLALLAGAYGWLAAASVRTPLIFVAVFLLTLEVLPPLYFAGPDATPVHAAVLLAPIVLVIVLLRLPDCHFPWDAVAVGLALFLWGTALSLPFAWWLSGAEAGRFSLSRWVMLAQAGLVFFLIRGTARRNADRTERGLFGLLFAGAVVSAGYGVVDFFWPIPIPHPAADQFIWLQGAVLRRAQGVFYESSSFASFCGFFLIAAALAWLGRRERYLGVPRWLLLGCIPVLALAVLVAFSRSVWASVATALLAACFLPRFVKLRRGAAVGLAFAAPVLLLWAISPELWDYLLRARLGRLGEILHDPDIATSGRFETWVRVVSLMREHPPYLVFGIGYKTLPVTRLFQNEIITDNGYLSLLVETGVAGLGCFLIWTGAILRTFWRLTRAEDDRTAFWAAVVFSIWCGQLMQFLAADAYTYWRNLTVCAALMALTLNLAERAGRSEKAP